MNRQAWIACALLALVAVAPVHGVDDKSGVTPEAISRPSGPGSLEGLGDAFQPALNTGMAQYTVPITVPDGVAGFTPALALTYDAGRGFGVAGMGWSLGPGCVRRQTDEGLPRYGQTPDGVDAPDRFLGMEGEELVALQGGYYLAKTEGLFIRYALVGDHWEAHTKSGIKLEFGSTPDGRVASLDGTKVYAWCLQRQTDPFGNVIEYTYAPGEVGDAQVYLSEIRYGPGPGPWDHAYIVRFYYEDRPDPFDDYRPGFLVRTTKRLVRVDVQYDEQLIRRYELGYEADAQRSFLTTITTIGADGVTPLPATAFGYALFDLPDPAVPVSAADAVMGAIDAPPQVFDHDDVDLLDVNGDGLPDLLSTGVGHAAYLNRGPRAGTGGGTLIQWEGPIDVAVAEPRISQFDLSSERVHLADMTGDGIADLVITDEAAGYVEFFANTHAPGWSAGQLMSTEGTAPPAPFGSFGSSVKTIDLGFDKRMDVIQSASGAYFSWFGHGDGRYTGPIVTEAVRDDARPVDFADPGVQLADMNGDRLLDIVKVKTFGIAWWPSQGYGRFGSRVELALPDRSLDDSPGGNLHRARLVDVDGDGLADLIVERAQGSNLWFYRNSGDGTLALSRVIADLPVGPALRFADINGNGTKDLVYADSSRPDGRLLSVDIAVLLGGAAQYNVLTRIDNGYGRAIHIEYGVSTDYAVEAQVLGHPWTTQLPFPVSVVRRSYATIGLDLDGFDDEGPEGDRYITDYVYRDGYYDAIEQQFRGFSFVKQINRGDERFGGTDAPTLVTRYAFHTGAPDGVDNDGDGETDEPGDLWIGREEEPLKGVRLWEETTSLPDDPTADGAYADDAVVFERAIGTWEVRNLCTSDGGAMADLLGTDYRSTDHYGREVRLAVQSVVHRSVIERESGPAKQVETLLDVDPLGNLAYEWSLGDLSASEDELYTGYEYAFNASAWMMNRVSRQFQTNGGADGDFVSETRHYYDGAPFVGLPLGQLGSRGALHRTESLVSKDPVPEITQRSRAIGDPRSPGGVVNLVRQQVDPFGNTSGFRDANGNYRFFQYDDALHKFPTQETIVVGGGSDNLVLSATYDHRFGAIRTLIDPAGQTSRFVYDDFGRMVEEYLPGDPVDQPTRTFSYLLQAPVSAITTTACDNVSGMPDIGSVSFFDGLGRKLGSFDVGGGVMSEVTRYNTRGWPCEAYQPYFGGDGTWSLPGGTVPSITQAYDATARIVETVSAPDDNGITARSTSEHMPLMVLQFDGEDNNTTGTHANTPKTLVYDGLGRLTEVHEVETQSQVDPGVFATTYRYALPKLLAEIEDAAGNVKYMRYDGLGRRIFLNDLDRGHVVYTYDDAGYVVQRVDALGQVITYAYDGANRVVSEDYLDDGHPLSRQRTPDVAYHYDQPHPDFPALAHTAGRLAWVEDLTGAEVLGYDQRGQVETVVKRIEQPAGGTVDYLTQSLTNNRGQVYRTIYPDGQQIDHVYNARGRLQSIPGFVSEITYTPSGQRNTCTLANTAMTSYAYDARQRLTALTTASAHGGLQDLAYDYDQVANIVGISDNRALAPGDPRDQTVDLEVDDLYRLTGVLGTTWGSIAYDYDRLGNMAEKVSEDIVDPDVNVGTMTSGGSGGTAGRVGRELPDPPGPHALTATDNGAVQRSYTYDPNGNLVDNGDTTYTYDFADRLGQVDAGGADIRYFYDYTSRRVIKRVGGAQTSYVNAAFEVREGLPIRYVLVGGARIARVDDAAPAPEVTTQSIALQVGWNLVSFQVDPGTTDPAAVLASISGLYVAAFGQDGDAYTFYQPGNPASTLTTMVPGRAYWLLMAAAGQWTLEGPVSLAAVSVPANTPVMVGMPGFSGQSVAAWRQRYPQIRRMWFYAPTEDRWKAYAADEPAYLSTLTTTAAGQGYWIVSDQAIELTGVVVGDVHFYHPDHLGSTSFVTDAGGGLVSEYFTYPYGSSRYEYHVGAPYDPYYRFTGKEQDWETGLHYFEARYHNSGIGRFQTVDPWRVSEFATAFPAKLNLYAYAENRPMRLTDPTGLDPLDSASPFGYLQDVLGAANDMAGLPGKAKEALDTARNVFDGPLGQVQDTIEKVERGIGEALGTVRKATAFARRIADLAKPAKPAGSTPTVVGMAKGAYDLIVGIGDRSVKETVSSAAGLIASIVGVASGEQDGLGLGDTGLGAVLGTLKDAYEDITKPPTGDFEDVATDVATTIGEVGGAAKTIIDRVGKLGSAEGIISLIVEVGAIAIDYFTGDDDE